MKNEIIESDWKALRRIMPELRERYIARIIGELRQILEASDASATDCFWNAHEKINEEVLIIQNCLDGARRSRMHHMVNEMLYCGMMNLEDLSVFSAELQDRAKSWYRENR